MTHLRLPHRTQEQLPMEASCQRQADEDEMVDMEERKAADETEDDTSGELGEGGLDDLRIDDEMEDRGNEDLGEEWSDEDGVAKTTSSRSMPVADRR